ncbi:MAG: phosphoenolpyruvate--protein phosphotransferase [Candidatus Lambdaproteobacteria bacterium]|nr:phosphoenolpyruvate--protein phosphotransferase [Candidatus Lambdaproteobacteria bacterium]
MMATKAAETAQPQTAQGSEIEQLAVRQNHLLQTLIDIGRIITTSHGLDETLQHTVDLIAERMGVDVCSIYLYNDEQRLLELKATHGLHPGAVGKVSMPVNEGLVGLIVEDNRVVNVTDAPSHPRFKYFPSINEERLASFMGVPLIEYRRTLGALCLQNQEDRLFTKDEENLLLTIASQISGLVSKALVVHRIQEAAGRAATKQRRQGSYQMQGIPIAPGQAQHRAVLLKRREMDEPQYARTASAEEELRALHQALERSIQEIIELIREVSRRATEQDAAIFHAHLLFLEDRTFIQKFEHEIAQGASAAWAVSHVVKEYLKAFKGIDDPYLRERAVDVEDVGTRVLHHLGMHTGPRVRMDVEGILVAELLTPSDTAQLDPTKVKGIITSLGGHVSHAAILARSLRIPAVTGIENPTETLLEGEPVLVDGDAGVVFVNPAESVGIQYQRYQETRRAYLSHLDELRDVLCATRDGHRISLKANLGLPQDLDDFDRYAAEGVGLFRTEIFYLMRDVRPTIADLEANYGRVLEVARGKPVIIRTLDLGGDKFPSYLDFPKEENPFLGCRSIRYQLSRTWLLRDQLKAILRVAHQGDVHLMFPMISHIEELHEVRRIYEDCRVEVANDLGRALPKLPIGMMFEVPSAVLMCELFAGEVDFFSIGSNDLTQYVLAVDRNNPHVSNLYDPLDPAVLMMIKRVIDTAAKYGKPCELCGEMASDPEGCLVLVGMGLRELSMNSPLIPLVKDRLSKITLAEMQDLARIAMNSTTAENVRRNIQRFIQH